MQFKVWLLGLSPMVWRRVHVPADFTLRQLHGVIQVAMGWEGAHLFQFHLRAVRYGSSEVSARSPEATLESLRFRRGARFVYEYDLNVPWRHEISSAFVEATVNAVVSKRFAKKQQMQWTRRGAHLLLQTRTRALDRIVELPVERVREHDKVWGGSAYGSISAGSRGRMGQSVT